MVVLQPDPVLVNVLDGIGIEGCGDLARLMRETGDMFDRGFGTVQAVEDSIGALVVEPYRLANVDTASLTTAAVDHRCNDHPTGQGSPSLVSRWDGIHTLVDVGGPGM